jgi:hypothetical protein
MNKYIFSIDVECVGLYGDVFSVGVSIMDQTGNEIDNLFLRADHNINNNNYNNLFDNIKWIEEHVIPTLDPINCDNLLDLRDHFWDFYIESKKKYPNMIVISDCGSPCESGFFRTCILDDLVHRQWLGPYPLHELGTLLLARGKDPVGTYERNNDELPKHNPLCDARQSGRIWIENQ